MAKKYIPSGYQIINISVTATALDGTPFSVTATTEDEKILCDLLEHDKQFTKPILLNFHEISNDYTLSGFVTCIDGQIILGDISTTNNSLVKIEGNDETSFIVYFVGN